MRTKDEIIQKINRIRTLAFENSKNKAEIIDPNEYAKAYWRGLVCACDSIVWMIEQLEDCNNVTK